MSLTSVMVGEAVESIGGIPVFLSLASGMAFPKPLKTSCSLKVVYFLMCHLNSLTLIAKGQGSLGTSRLASSAQY